jgi:hypothetical protein
MIGQLAFDEDAVLLARVRAAVTEPGMSPTEIDAAVEDARRRLGLDPCAATEARPCVCEQGAMLLVDAFAVDRRCARCGREPRR